MAKTYLERKAQARQEAIERQHEFAEHDYSYYELMLYGNYFYQLGMRYGLLKEFREHGIV